MKNYLRLISVLLLVFLFGLSVFAQETFVYQFVNGNWYDGKSFKKRTFYSVNGILASKKPFKIDETIDLKNQFVIPPFAEAHSHKLDLRSELEAQKKSFIKEGTMYVMVLNNHGSKAILNRPIFNQPNTLDVLYANGGITHTGQHPSFAYERINSGIDQWWLPENTKIIQNSRKVEGDAYWFFDSIADVDKKWDAYLGSKPEIVKIYLMDVKNDRATPKSISTEVSEYVTKKAHDAGLRVVAHIETFDDLKIGLKIGVDIFAHLPHYNYFFSPTEPEQPTFSNQELKMIRQRKIVLIPTLSLTENYAIVRDASNNYQGKFDEIRFGEVVKFQKKTIATLKNAGFRFAIGSDGDSLLPELNYWVKNNVFDAAFTLHTAAVITPQMMYPKRKIGKFQDGYEASFITVSENPLIKFETLKSINLRFKQGVFIELKK
jgi:imidazolonepropionase-like amidohydrolase